MFEEVEARAYHILDEKIKSYIEGLKDSEREFRKLSDEYMSYGHGFETECGYLDGRARSLDLVAEDLNSIIKTVERIAKKEIEAEFKRYEEYADVADSACSKQL